MSIKLLSEAPPLEFDFETLVHSLVQAAEDKDPWTRGHSARVMRCATAIGRVLGHSPQDLATLRYGALVHDVGKIGIPTELLRKPGALSSEEFELVKLHALFGYRIIEGFHQFEECLPLVLYHHERLDGSGYPFGLSGRGISPLVRIIAVADSFDAITSDRAYRSGSSQRFGIQELRLSASANKLDADVVEALAQLVSEEALV